MPVKIPSRCANFWPKHCRQHQEPNQLHHSRHCLTLLQNVRNEIRCPSLDRMRLKAWVTRSRYHPRCAVAQCRCRPVERLQVQSGRSASLAALCVGHLCWPVTVPPVPQPDTHIVGRSPAKSPMISRAVVDSWMSAFAEVSNWRARNQPCAQPVRLQHVHAPVPFCARGVSTTFAPSIRISRRRSTEKLSAIAHSNGCFLRANHREPDASVAAGHTPHHSLPRLQGAVALCRFNDVQRQPILD